MTKKIFTEQKGKYSVKVYLKCCEDVKDESIKKFITLDAVDVYFMKEAASEINGLSTRKKITKSRQ
jgi:hypothetical protein